MCWCILGARAGTADDNQNTPTFALLSGETNDTQGERLQHFIHLVFLSLKKKKKTSLEQRGSWNFRHGGLRDRT